jgi:hypothetical protein
MIEKCPKCKTTDFTNCHSMRCPMRKQKGGKRVGSGRKKANYQTKTIAFRVRVEWIEVIKSMVKDKVAELSHNLG